MRSEGEERGRLRRVRKRLLRSRVALCRGQVQQGARLQTHRGHPVEEARGHRGCLLDRLVVARGGCQRARGGAFPWHEQLLQCHEGAGARVLPPQDGHLRAPPQPAKPRLLFQQHTRSDQLGPGVPVRRARGLGLRRDRSRRQAGWREGPRAGRPGWRLLGRPGLGERLRDGGAHPRPVAQRCHLRSEDRPPGQGRRLPRAARAARIRALLAAHLRLHRPAPAQGVAA
mmetsp:Transcript_133754/g.372883  ORF Transcript_133754/g.372883 Transcript_133754/m.372883 type:complete len:228 (+) Transcript_133754:320-1003(+)